MSSAYFSVQSDNFTNFLSKGDADPCRMSAGVNISDACFTFDITDAQVQAQWRADVVGKTENFDEGTKWNLFAVI